MTIQTHDEAIRSLSTGTFVPTETRCDVGQCRSEKHTNASCLWNFGATTAVVVAMRTCLSALFVLGAAATAHAHPALELPQPSPHARTDQRVGLTELSIDYSSPGVKGRKIWGDLLPWGKVWRAGANAATKLTASRAFTFGGV